MPGLAGGQPLEAWAPAGMYLCTTAHLPHRTPPAPRPPELLLQATVQKLLGWTTARLAWMEAQFRGVLSAAAAAGLLTPPAANGTAGDA